MAIDAAGIFLALIYTSSGIKKLKETSKVGLISHTMIPTLFLLGGSIYALITSGVADANLRN
ncbi:hypothetical protein [Microbulbifer discodermiae]|uniref:hypothetical protein n=1 Tax=Microbulbifer sp. 2201CG32-9 TaxID=3232309 RepID=UPI00345B6621